MRPGRANGGALRRHAARPVQPAAAVAGRERVRPRRGADRLGRRAGALLAGRRGRPDAVAAHRRCRRTGVRRSDRGLARRCGPVSGATPRRGRRRAELPRPGLRAAVPQRGDATACRRSGFTAVDWFNVYPGPKVRAMLAAAAGRRPGRRRSRGGGRPADPRRRARSGWAQPLLPDGLRGARPAGRRGGRSTVVRCVPPAAIGSPPLVGALATDAVLRRTPAPGVHFAADVLDPAAVVDGGPAFRGADRCSSCPRRTASEPVEEGCPVTAAAAGARVRHQLRPLLRRSRPRPAPDTSWPESSAAAQPPPAPSAATRRRPLHRGRSRLPDDIDVACVVVGSIDLGWRGHRPGQGPDRPRRARPAGTPSPSR